MSTDRFGNAFAAGLPYARGRIIASTEDDFRELRRAWALVEARIRRSGPGSVFNFSGLERGLPLRPDDLALADDEIGPAVHGGRLEAVALAHLGGERGRHDVALFNRMTAATLATHLALVERGETVVGVSPAYSHPSVVRAVEHVGARFVDCRGVVPFARALEREPRVRLVVVTRLSVTYELLPLDTLREIVRLTHEHSALVYLDDAGGARVGPAVFDQPRMLELGVDVGATGLDKYGTVGPRLGLLGGERSLVARIRARGLEFGLEARPMLYAAALRSLETYSAGRVRALVDCTRRVAAALRARLGARLTETPITAQLHSDDILACAMERAGIETPPVVPSEAKAALAMILLEDHGILTVHFAGRPPGTASMLFKFVPPETLERFGGADAFADAVDTALDRLAGLLKSPDEIRVLLLGATDRMD